MRTLRPILSAVVLLGFASAARADDLYRPHLHVIWSLSGFQEPESVVYEPREGVFYVSNMNGAADAKDDNGYISKVSADGRFLQKGWATGLNAPKGLTISGRKLYVADIDQLVQITFSNQAKHRYPGAGAKFLNDVTSDAYGRIYVSDMMTDAIYRFVPGSKKGLQLWVRDPRLAAPNGLLGEKDRIVVASWGKMTDGFQTKVPGHLLTVSLRSRAIATLGNGEPVGNLDGLEPASGGNFFVTDWMKGQLLLVSPQGNFVKVQDIGAGAADLTYLEGEKILVIPIMKEGRLVAYAVD